MHLADSVPPTGLPCRFKPVPTIASHSFSFEESSSNLEASARLDIKMQPLYLQALETSCVLWDLRVMLEHHLSPYPKRNKRHISPFLHSPPASHPKDNFSVSMLIRAISREHTKETWVRFCVLLELPRRHSKSAIEARNRREVRMLAMCWMQLHLMHFLLPPIAHCKVQPCGLMSSSISQMTV